MNLEVWAAIGILLILLLSSLPIGIALAIGGTIGLLFIGNPGVALGALEAGLMGSPASMVLVTVPLFLLMANIMSEAGIIDELYTATSNWLSRLPGGLALSTIGAGVVLGSVSGATTASAAAMSRVALPSMKKYQYSDSLASSSVALGASLSLLIPPSVMLIVYGSATETSIGQLLIAGLIPGLILALLLAVAIIVWVVLQPSAAQATYSTPWGEKFRSLKGVLPFLVLMIAILGLLYSGVITPTEVGAVGAALALLIGVVMGRLSFPRIGQAVMATLRGTVMIFIIMAGAVIFAQFLSLARIPQELSGALLALDMPGWMVIVVIIITYLILSMLMDELPLMLMTLPITLPIVTALGYDPIWFGVMTMLTVILGLITPPVGMLVFVVSASSGMKSGVIFRGTAVLLIPVVVAIALILIWPDIVLWLPALMQ